MTTPKQFLRCLCVLLAVGSHSAQLIAQEVEWQLGLSAQRSVISALGILASSEDAPTILYLAGLNGPSEASGRVRALVSEFSNQPASERTVNLIAIPVANPEDEGLQFPPTGDAYAENPVSHALWRWIGAHAPDLIVMSDDSQGLAAALANQTVAGFGSIPVESLSSTSTTVDYLLSKADQPRSAAGRELDRRVARSPQQLARLLATSYGYDFSTPAYVPGMSLIGRMRLGDTESVETLLEPYLAGEQFEVSNSSVMAGQLVFVEHAERTGNAASLALVRRAAELAFDEAGNLRDVMPMHYEMSDSFFMATPLLVKAGKLTGDYRYFDMAARHVSYMRNMLLRDNGLYRHSPEADVAWSRGNGFPALGLALSLSDFPMDHPARDLLLGYYAMHLEALLPHQDADGMWHEVIDYPGSFAEITSTAMIGIAIKRGIDRGWIEVERYQPILDRAWQAVNIRSSFDGEFLNACTSTGKMPSLDAYLDRLAIFGRDDRAGGMVMNFAAEMAGL